MTEVAEPTLAHCPAAPRGWHNPLDPFYGMLPEGRPLTKIDLPRGNVAWLVAHHDHAKRLLTDPRMSAAPHPKFPVRFEAPQEILDQINKDCESYLVTMDAPRHTKVRQMALPDFTIKAAQSRREMIQRVVDRHLDAMEAGGKPADIMQALALPAPAEVLCELAAIPQEDRAGFQKASAILVANRASHTPEQRIEANDWIMTNFDKLVTAKEENPGDDIISHFIVRNRETQEFDHRGLILMTKMLLIAGYESMANRIALGVQALVEHPDQLAELTADPQRLMSKATDEILRYFSLVDEIIARVALEDVEIDGVTIRAGEGIIVLKGLADRDPDAYPDPDAFDIHRDAREHLAFGYGIHQCLGQHVGRLILEICLSSLINRYPNLHLVEDTEPVELINGLPPVHKLLVSW